MKVLMIGTPVCTKCKSMLPIIEEYCSNHVIRFKYQNLSEISAEVFAVLNAKNIKTAPVFFIYRDGEESPVVVSGDDVYLELEMERE